MQRPPKTQTKRPDTFLRGGIYPVNMPPQIIEERTDGQRWERRGNEMSNNLDGKGHPCVVVSSNDFNSAQQGLVVVPMTTKVNFPRSWDIRVRIDETSVAYAVCDQIRYVDKSRCGPLIGRLFNEEGTPTQEFTWIENAIKKLLF